MTDTEFNLCVRELREHVRRTSFSELESQREHGYETDLEGVEFDHEGDTGHV